MRSPTNYVSLIGDLTTTTGAGTREPKDLGLGRRPHGRPHPMGTPSGRRQAGRQAGPSIINPPWSCSSTANTAPRAARSAW
jgi:hypothetical protein